MKKEELICPGCKGLTAKKKITIECGECRGEGYTEEENWLNEGYHYETCTQCQGKGELQITSNFCSSDCYENWREYQFEY